MLVLSRREGESILIPELNIQISILKSSGSRVQIGIQAPRDVVIRRGELEMHQGELKTAISAELLNLPLDAVVAPVPADSLAKNEPDLMSVRSAAEGYAVLSA
jgi:carbon storage regulator